MPACPIHGQGGLGPVVEPMEGGQRTTQDRMLIHLFSNQTHIKMQFVRLTLTLNTRDMQNFHTSIQASHRQSNSKKTLQLKRKHSVYNFLLPRV